MIMEKEPLEMKNYPYKNELVKQLNDCLKQIRRQNTGIAYVQLCYDMSHSLKSFGRNVLLIMIHDIEEQFRIRAWHMKRYYVKYTRKRIIMSIFGPITFHLTEYQDRLTKENYYCVDQKFSIIKRDSENETTAILRQQKSRIIKHIRRMKITPLFRSKDKKKYKFLFDYAQHQGRRFFQTLVDSIIEDKPQNRDTVQKNSDYILSHIKTSGQYISK
jgi:hypothetical protein